MYEVPNAKGIRQRYVCNLDVIDRASGQRICVIAFFFLYCSYLLDHIIDYTVRSAVAPLNPAEDFRLNRTI